MEFRIIFGGAFQNMVKYFFVDLTCSLYRRWIAETPTRSVLGYLGPGLSRELPRIPQARNVYIGRALE